MGQSAPESQEIGTGSEFATLERLYIEQQRQARYPDLFPASAAQQAYHHLRSQSGLVTVALRHGTLTARQGAALGIFRLQQFALCGWYDLAAIMNRGLLSDPTLAQCPDATIHILVGTQSDCRVLAYFCLQASPQLPHDDCNCGRGRSRPARMADRDRPLFPTEYDQCGPEVFASLPSLAALSMTRVVELACLLSNRAISSPLSFAALIEGFYTVSILVRDHRLGIDAMIGHVDVDARHLVKRLGVPVLYAPLVPPIPNRQDELWSKDVLEPGRFWPFVIATADLRRHARWFARMDEALDADETHLKRSLVNLLRHPVPTPPRAFLPPRPSPDVATDTAEPFFWTDDASYDATTATSQTAHV